MNIMLDESSISVNLIERELDYSYRMKLLSDRVERILAETGWSKATMARICGSRRAAPTEWTKGKVRHMSAVYAAAIAAASKFHATWIATGEGPVYQNEPPKAATPESDWPFKSFSKAQFDALPDIFKGRVEQAALTVVKEWEQSKSTAA